MAKVFVIVPCYNEAGCVCQTLTHLRAIRPDVTIVAVNDGSSDDTLECLYSLNDPQLVVIDLPVNSGIGTAVQTGLLYAERHGAEYALKFDSDGQHLAEEIELLLEPLQNKTADVVIGSRFLDPQMQGFKSTLFRRLGIHLFHFFKQNFDRSGHFGLYQRISCIQSFGLEFCSKILSGIRLSGT